MAIEPLTATECAFILAWHQLTLRQRRRMKRRNKVVYETLRRLNIELLCKNSWAIAAGKS